MKGPELVGASRRGVAELLQVQRQRPLDDGEREALSYFQTVVSMQRRRPHPPAARMQPRRRR